MLRLARWYFRCWEVCSVNGVGVCFEVNLSMQPPIDLLCGEGHEGPVSADAFKEDFA